MTFQEAVKKSIIQFMDGKLPKNLMEMSKGELYYTPEYFDGFEKSLEEDGEAPEIEEEDDEV